MTDRNETIDRITHGTLTQTIQAIVNELLDQGFEPWQISAYMQEKYNESEDYITQQTRK